MAHLHSQRTKVHSTAAFSNVVADLSSSSGVRCSDRPQNPSSVRRTEPASAAQGADDVSSGNPTVCCTVNCWQMMVAVYEGDHEKEISQSDGETMKKVIINEASTLVDTVANLKAPAEVNGAERGRQSAWANHCFQIPKEGRRTTVE